MFLFYDTNQTDINANYHKGVLFETMLKSYFEHSGYDVKIRQKHNSLEYDLEGTLKTTGQKIVGEAKAQGKSMSGKTLAAFVGKLVPLGVYDKEVHGLFLSTSALTSEADDYYRSLKNIGVTCKTGVELFNDLANIFKLPNTESLSKITSTAGYDTIAKNLLQTNTGLYIVLVLKKHNSGTPSFFTIFNSDGTELTDVKFIDNVRKNVAELNVLKHVSVCGSSGSESTKTERIVAQGLSVGTEWADYRLPAGPSVFVGRKKFIKDVISQIENSEIPNVIQIKSRSGVGKSSVLAFLEESLRMLDVRTELHDSRDIKSVFDIYSVISRFTKNEKTPEDFREVQKFLSEFYESLNGKKAVFFVDQFESTFQNPEMFECYELLAKIFTGLGDQIYLILARKNDQLTTHDNTKVSLDQINRLSNSYVLPDFEKNESIELIDKINKHTQGILSKEILPYITEFAQGFPWLLKRTMAHVLKLTKRGASQKELIGAGLKLDDLFEEELEGLDEIEKDYLTRIAAKLPADFNELQYQFDEDPYLTNILEKLTESRLLRLSGTTYDTYNDVFKEYLVYQKLPEFRQPIIYRMFPNMVIAQFHKIIEFKTITVDLLKQKLDVSEGYTFNLIKELRNLDLIHSIGNGWAIPTSIKDIYAQGRLAGHLRKALVENNLISKLISKDLNGESLKEDELVGYFSDQYPYIEASEKTWGTYSTILKSWLLALRLMEIDKIGKLVLVNQDKEKIIRELGNLHEIAGLRAGNRGLFFPMTSHSKMVKVMQDLVSTIEPTDKEGIKAKSDLKSAGILVDGNLAVSSEKELNEALSSLLQDEGFKNLWEAINNGKPCYTIFTEIVGNKLAESTIKWRLRKLTALAKKLGIIPNKHLPY